ncbi:putative polyketide synthase [Durotheca rogersii]|uniref:putative polyketide synthase n=1 Tax=Durotheca rogersii TaxID=419775 RepID=UPI0022203F33|nr:putative polyketide synthase [Durotheca rogersii]KAI5861144.1 putative polyketide synthase [Durotheca rogersii]
MVDQSSGPDTLLFGSLALSFDASTFQQVRKAVIESDESAWLADVVRTLPRDCDAILSGIPGLQASVATARSQVTDLSDAFTTGRLPETPFPLPNALLIPLVTINQLALYADFVQQASLGNDGENAWVSHRRQTLGLCTGLLSAFAASSARNAEEFRRYGAAAVRLALLVGLVIDNQDALSGKGRYRSLSAAWSPNGGQEEMIKILKDSEETYVSVHFDENRATITTSAEHVGDLTRRLKAAGLSASEIGLYGRFHFAGNSALVEQAITFCEFRGEFQLSDAASLATPTRGNDLAGSLLKEGALHAHALRSILLQPPRWFDAFSAATLRGNGENVHVFDFGPERSIPLSLTSRPNLKVDYLSDRVRSKIDRRPDRLWRDSDIAVVGMSCRVAGASNLEDFWDLLVAGESQHREISTSSRFSFDDTPFRTSSDANMNRKWFANLLDNHDHFDHRFFKKSARESATMDPQQRQILQVAYQAVEQSGYFRGAESERNAKIGCYVGVCLGDYDNNVACHAANAFTATGNLQGFIAGKVSHFFGWTGPGLTIDTACSSSLVAVHQACQSILTGECEAALAGGTHVMTSASWFQNLAAGSFLSPTGQCKPFDAKADGYCRGEGVGAVFLKKMSKAVADGDPILGVIAATAVQQNQNCTPIFVPNVPSLGDLFSTVTAKAHIKPSQISVVEAHGTGTAVGDPAEYDSIRKVLGGANRSGQPLMVSSVKGLVGHMECTSGIISLIKVLLMLNKGTLPPQASFKTLNPALNSTDADQMFIPTRVQPWDVDFRAALINNYGASGSNASLVVTQSPSLGKALQNVSQIPANVKYPFWISSFDKKSLYRYVKAFRKYISRSGGDTSLANLSFNVARQSNRTLESGLMFSARSIEELDRNLASFEKSDDSNVLAEPSASSATKRPVILCFGGQISTYVGLDRQLYDNVAVLRKHLNHVDAVVQSIGHPSIFPGIFQREPILDTAQLQIMLFSTQYACARSWIDSGIQPEALVGHSFGELTALCVSQVLSLEDTIKMIVRRATLVRDSWGSDKGAMMAIEADLSDVEQLLAAANGDHSDKPASIACYNGPRSFTLAGSTRAIDAVAAQVEKFPTKTLRTKRLNVTNAFHSALVDPLVDSLEKGAQSLTFRKPVIPLEFAKENAGEVDLTAKFVADHMRNPVYFHHAVERLARRYASSPCVFLEAGTNSTITSMAARALGNVKGAYSFHSVNISNCDDAWDKLTDTTVSLWKTGLRVQHWAHHGLQRNHQADIVPLLLPPYQFDPEARHWMELKAIPKSLPVEEETAGAIEQKQPEGLLTFFGYQDGATQREARFRINTSTEKYKKLLSGHLTMETAPICPATIQIGFVVDAIGSLHPEYQAKTQPQMQDVEYQSPICANSARVTWIDVKNNASGDSEWRFEVYSTEAQSQARMVHTTGKISFSSPEDPALRRQMVRFERLFGHNRATDLLQGTDVDEVLANRSIYRIFSEIVDYGDEFRGLQKMVTRGNETAGHVVRVNSDPDLWFDPHLSDTFCQLGGLWINCMTDRSRGDVYLANGIDQWIRAVPTGKHSNEFNAFAVHHRQSDRLSLTDVFVFDAADGSLVEVILGVAYVKIPKPSMEKLLTRLTEPGWLAKSPAANVPSLASPITLTKLDDVQKKTKASPSVHQPTTPPSTKNPAAEQKAPKSSKRASQDDLLLKVKAILADLTGLEISEIKNDSDLADLGIDSLAGMEMVHEIETTLKVHLPEAEILTVTTFPELMKCVAGAMGVDVQSHPDSEEPNEDLDTDTASMASSDGAPAFTNLTSPSPESIVDKEEYGESDDFKLSFATVMEAFNETKKLTDSRIATMGQTHYVAESLPLQNELTVAFTIEAFEALGAGFSNAQPGQQLSRIPHGKEHVHFVTYLYEMLETETQIIKLDGDTITRTAVPLPRRHSKEIYDEMARSYPDQAPADKLTYYAGANLKRVLSGETDGVKLIFGSTEGRELVGAFYADWPLNRVMYAQMEDFFTRLAEKLRARPNGLSESKPLRILEMGAGTGGTTKRIVPLLAQLQIPVEYTFTDLAPSFVAAARKKWGKQYPWMKFRAHDIEKAPDADLESTQHFVLASNAVHATHSLCVSTANVRKALRPDGYLFMLEMTRTPYWVDLIFGLFEGWWLFDDGRRHALTHESRWEKDLQAVGYGHVDWTVGERQESEIEKLILAAASLTSRSERLENVATLGYLPKKGATADCEAREQVVSKYVRELTQGFDEAMSRESGARRYRPEAKCVLITGATGGLGAHLVATAALRSDVKRVVCLNRPSKQDPRERQIQALRKKGLELAPDVLAKIDVLETDLGQPAQLGLSDNQYQSLLEDVTHITHNAWLMHSKWPVKRFEPQLRIMVHMLELARDISLRRPSDCLVTFEFVSSIATIGHHPLWTGKPVVPEERVPIESVLPTGYGDAKYICERMLDSTLHRFPRRFRATAVRLGQIAGSSINGHWNSMEHVSFMIKSSQTLSALPDLPGSMGWTPADDVAAGLIEILTQPDEVALHPIYHIENPLRQPWSEVTAILADALSIPRGPSSIIPFQEWVQRVRTWPRREDNGPEGANPGYLLVDFLDTNFIRMSCGGLLMGTAKAREHSPTLAKLGPVSEDLIRLFIRSWQQMGFLA